MRIKLTDVYGNSAELEAEAIEVQVSGSLEQFGQTLAQLPAATATKEIVAAAPPAIDPIPDGIKAHCMGVPFEPDPRSVKCENCPHSAFEHSDAGCLKRGVTEKEFRTPGVMGYCNCGLTYAHIMRTRKNGQ